MAYNHKHGEPAPCNRNGYLHKNEIGNNVGLTVAPLICIKKGFRSAIFLIGEGLWGSMVLS